MSLLREAERFIANQHAQGFNAFITPLPRAGRWLDRVKEADRRTEQGMYFEVENIFPSTVTDRSVNLNRDTQVACGRPSDIY